LVRESPPIFAIPPRSALARESKWHTVYQVLYNTILWQLWRLKDPRRRTHLKTQESLHTVHRYRSNPDMLSVNSVTNKSNYQTYFDVSIVKTHYLHSHVVSED